MIPVPTLTPLTEENEFAVRGTILRNKNLKIDVNSDTNSIGIQTNSKEELFDNLDTFLTTIKDILPANKKAWFYEFQGNIKFPNKSDVISKTNISGNIIDKVSEFSNKIGIKSHVSSIGFWSEEDSDSENFMEIKIQQDILDNTLSVYKIIYRNPDENVFKNSINILTDITLLSKIL